MYLTRLTLDPRSAQARRDLGDAYEMHRSLVRAFVADEQEAPPRFLWRLEPGTNPWASPTLLVQSRTGADWEPLQALKSYLQRAPETKVVDLDWLIEDERRYRFRLVANPVVKKAEKRRGLVGEPEQLGWLRRQGERHGFEVEAALVTGSDVLEARARGDARITLLRVCFEGLLRVKMAEAMRRALVDGVGPAKAFGCGLLSVART
jgi:CRISPR system Cascade subunit CasE